MHLLNGSTKIYQDQTNIEDAVKGNLNVESAQENVDKTVREYSSAESMQQHVEDDVRVDASADSEQKHVEDTTEVDKSDQSVVNIDIKSSNDPPEVWDIEKPDLRQQGNKPVCPILWNKTLSLRNLSYATDTVLSYFRGEPGPPGPW